MVSSQEVVRVVNQTWVEGKSLWEIWRPDTHVGVLGLMHSHVWWPHSIMNNSLSKVPFLEEITSTLLMGWMNFREVHHLLNDFVLLEALVDQQIVLLMHRSVTSLARSLPDLEASSKCLWVEGIPGDLGWPMRVSMVHSNTVNLLFITLDTVWRTDVVSEEPGFCFLMTQKERLGGQQDLTIGDRGSERTDSLCLSLW